MGKRLRRNGGAARGLGIEWVKVGTQRTASHDGLYLVVERVGVSRRWEWEVVEGYSLSVVGVGTRRSQGAAQAAAAARARQYLDRVSR